MNLFDKIKADLGPYLDETNKLILEQASSEVKLIPLISNYLLESGGKRLRPLLTLMFAKAYNAPIEPSALLASSVEMIHTATLLHDDVIDQSELRRGRKTANNVWGNKEAILVGDFLLAQSFCMMVKTDSIKALKLLAEASKTITESEVWQLDLLFDTNLAIESYLKLIEGKTAVLFAAAAAVIPTFLNRPAAEIENCYQFGLNLGLTFQMVDDILDYSASSAEIGKSTQNDVIEGKITLPLILTLSTLSTSEIAEIRSLLKSIAEGNKESSHKVYEIVKEHNGVQMARDFAASYSTKANQAISGLEPSYDTEMFKELLIHNNLRLN